MDSFTTLTGRWIGRYDYDRPMPGVPFEADIAETGGLLTGTTGEPNTLRPDLGIFLTASLRGMREGPEVEILKRYDGFTQEGHPSYGGRAKGALTRIEGRWQFAGQPDHGGRFVMMREPMAAARRAAMRQLDLSLPVVIGGPRA